MRTVRCAAFMVILCFPAVDPHALWAHEGHTHVMGTVTAVQDGQLAVQTKGGETVTIQLDRNTRYRAAGVAASSATIHAGDRVVVEVTEEANGLRAAEVRYAPGASQTP